MEGGPARWRKVSDAVAGFLRADGKLAPIYAELVPHDTVMEELITIANENNLANRDLAIAMAIYMLGFSTYAGFTK